MDGEVTSAVFGFKPRLTADPAHDLVFRMVACHRVGMPGAADMPVEADHAVGGGLTMVKVKLMSATFPASRRAPAATIVRGAFSKP
jgi:hypothetical protein